MKKYIRCHLVEATPMTRGAYNKKRGWTVPKDENPKDENPKDKGYLVKYPDGYVSWCPKAQFESQGFALEDGSKITEKDVYDFKLNGYQLCNTLADPNGKPFTMVQMVYPTGFTDFATSACIDPKNYKEIIGFNNCVEKINDRLWGFLGFMLQWAKFGLRNVGLEIAQKMDAEEAKKK